VTATSLAPGLEMLAQALEPFEFAIMIRWGARLQEQVLTGHYTHRQGQMAAEFAAEVGPKIVLGAYRAGHLSPPRFFFAHEERAYTAALIAMADSLATQPRGAPALIDLARASCRSALGGEAFEQLVQQAYREAGA